MDVYSPEMYHTVLFTRTHRTHGKNSKCLEFLVDGHISSIACMMRTCSAGLPRHSGQWQNVLALVHSSIEPGNKDGPGDGHASQGSIPLVACLEASCCSQNCYGMTTQLHKMGISIYLSVCLSIYLSIYLPTYLSIYLSMYLTLIYFTLR